MQVGVTPFCPKLARTSLRGDWLSCMLWLSHRLKGSDGLEKGSARRKRPRLDGHAKADSDRRGCRAMLRTRRLSGRSRLVGFPSERLVLARMGESKACWARPSSLLCPVVKGGTELRTPSMR